jgi:hypothetical protein
MVRQECLTYQPFGKERRRSYVETTAESIVAPGVFSFRGFDLLNWERGTGVRDFDFRDNL